MDLQNDVFFYDNEFGDLYMVIEREPKVIICTFEEHSDYNTPKVYKIYLDNQPYQFFANIYNDFPLYRGYKIYSYETDKYVKVPIGIDESADALFCEHFTTENFIMVPPESTLVTSLGRLVGIEYTTSETHVGARRIANRALYSDRGVKLQVPRFKFIHYDMDIVYF